MPKIFFLILNLVLISLYTNSYAVETQEINEIEIYETWKTAQSNYYDIIGETLFLDKQDARLNNRKKFKQDDFYQEFKNYLEKKYNLEYSIDLTYTPQRISPQDGQTSHQFIFAPNVNWTAFSNKDYGKLELEFAYGIIQYWGTEASKLSNQAGIISGINDTLSNANQFLQLLASYSLPHNMDWLNINIGQYSLYFIDGVAQNSNQQASFINGSLSQNASASYGVASLGAYLEITPTPEWLIQVGFQDANNIDGDNLEFNNLKDGKFANFAFISWLPNFYGKMKGQYNILTYNQPSTDNQTSDSSGWSFSFSQYFNKTFNIFGRVNGSTGNVTNIDKSYSLGFGFSNPFNRNQNDYAGISTSLNKANKNVVGSSGYESVIEAQYVYGIDKYITISPDLQFIINPVSNTENKNFEFVYGIRIGVLL